MGVLSSLYPHSEDEESSVLFIVCLLGISELAALEIMEFHCDSTFSNAANFPGVRFEEAEDGGFSLVLFIS